MLDRNQLRLRAATDDDVEALTELSHRTVLNKYPSVIGQEMVEGYVASGAVPQYYGERFPYCRIAELDGAPVGVCGLRDNSVDLMMVTLEHHRSGIGSVLLREAEARLFENHPSIFLNSFRDNDQAVRFYKKHGWTFEKEFVEPDYGIAMVRLGKSR